MRILIAAVMTAICVSGAAWSQTNSESEALVREMLAETGEVDVMMRAMDDMMPLIEGNIRANYPDLSSRQYAQITQVYRDEFANARNDFEAALVTVYASEFTTDELRQLVGFYQSPLGQRFTQALPRIQAAASQAGATVGTEVDRRAGPRVRAIILEQ